MPRARIRSTRRRTCYETTRVCTAPRSVDATCYFATKGRRPFACGSWCSRPRSRASPPRTFRLPGSILADVMHWCSVQEGLVFVSMTSTDLLDRTAAYQLSYPPAVSGSPSRAPGENDGQSHGPFPFPLPFNLGHDWSTAALPRPPSPPIAPTAAGPGADDRFNAPRLLIEENSRPGRSLTGQRADRFPEDYDDVIIQDLGGTYHAGPFRSPHVAMADGSDDEDDEEEEGQEMSPEVLAATARRRREAIALAMSDMEDDEDDDHVHAYRDDLISLGPLPLPKTPSRLTAPNRITYSPTTSRAAADDGHPTRSVLAPHARFFIKMDKSRCSIIFDPPV